ncbi:unnamed protein product [Lampetra planeri]
MDSGIEYPFPPSSSRARGRDVFTSAVRRWSVRRAAAQGGTVHWEAPGRVPGRPLGGPWEASGSGSDIVSIASSYWTARGVCRCRAGTTSEAAARGSVGPLGSRHGDRSGTMRE